MFDKIKPFFGPLRSFIGIVLAAVVLLWFWGPICHLVVEIATKAQGLFGK